jgi:hypothetical protein
VIPLLLVALAVSAPPPPEPPSAPLGTAWVLPAALGGGALMATGGVLLSLASRNHRWLTAPDAPPLAPAEATRLRAQESRFRTAGFVSLGVGVAALTAGILGWVLAPDGTFEFAVATEPHAVFALAGGRF